MKRPGTVTHVCAHSGEGADGSSPPPEIQTNEQLCLQSEWVTPEVDLWLQTMHTNTKVLIEMQTYIQDNKLKESKQPLILPLFIFSSTQW